MRKIIHNVLISVFVILFLVAVPNRFAKRPPSVKFPIPSGMEHSQAEQLLVYLHLPAGTWKLEAIMVHGTITSGPKSLTPLDKIINLSKHIY